MGDPQPAATAPQEYRGCWSSGPTLTRRRARGHSVTTLADGRVLVAGGSDPEGSWLDAVEVVDVDRGTATLVAPMRGRRTHHQACLLADGRVLVVGGFRGTRGVPLPAEVYDPARDTWMDAGHVGVGWASETYGMACAALPDGTALLVGGLTPSLTPSLDVKRWRGDAWLTESTVAGPLLWPWAATLPDGRVFLATENHAFVRESRGVFLPAGRPHTSRPDASWVLAPHGRVVVVGGNPVGPERSVESWSPVDRQWHTVAPLDRGRHGTAAACLGSGVVVVVGGSDGQSTYRDMLLWDPRLDTWFRGPLMDRWRAGGRVAALPRDRVVVVGGVTPGQGLPRRSPAACAVWTDDNNTLGHAVKRPGRARGVPGGVAWETTVLRALYRLWRHENDDVFGGALAPVVFEITDSPRKLAHWDGARSVIAVSREAIQSLLWPQLREVLKHEMAHQYVSEVLHVTDERPHGEAFRQVCARFAIDARAAGAPTVELTGAEQTVRRRVQKLRALAASSNPHEARTAQELADKLAQDYGELFAGDDDEEEAGFCVRHLGSHVARRTAFDQAVAAFLAAHGSVRPIWTDSLDQATGRGGSVLEILGTPANVERAAYLHDFLRRAVTGLWEEDQRAHGKGTAQQRMSFMVAALDAFSEKLKTPSPPSRDRALVLAAHARLNDFVRTRYPRLTFSHSRASHDPEASLRGREAGRTLQVHEGVGGNPGPRLLGGR